MGVVGCLIFTGCGKSTSFSRNSHLALNDSNYFETRGLNFFVFSNLYDATFDDSKISAVEIIHHGIRTATNGDVRMNPTPGQWDKYNPQNEMFRLLGTKRSFSQNETFFFSHPYPPTLPFST